LQQVFVEPDQKETLVFSLIYYSRGAEARETSAVLSFVRGGDVVL